MSVLGIIMMQVITMFQPEAIFETGSGGNLVAVESSREETSVRLHFPTDATLAWNVPLTAYLSDEADVHHPLLRSEASGSDWLLVFEALPPTTRVFDLVGDSIHRWIGIHSGVHSIHFPKVRPQLDENAEIADSIGKIIRDYSFEEVLRDDSLYAIVKARLPQLRNYVVWKWKLSAHEAFVLRRNQERYQPASPSPAASTLSHHELSATPCYIPASPPKRKNFFQRLFGSSKKKKEKEKEQEAATTTKPRPLSRFEQKMLQENRTQPIKNK